MIVLNMNKENIETIRAMHNSAFPFPDINNPLYISKKIVISDGAVIGAGFLRITAEGILILDNDRSQYLRARATAELIRSIKKEVQAKGLDECHVFIKEEKIHRFLEKLGFSDCKDKPMVLHF